MLKKIIFTAFAAGLVFGAQELAIKAKASSNSDANFEQAADESQLRVEEYYSLVENFLISCFRDGRINEINKSDY